MKEKTSPEIVFCDYCAKQLGLTTRHCLLITLINDLDEIFCDKQCMNSYNNKNKRYKNEQNLLG